jgi:transposase
MSSRRHDMKTITAILAMYTAGHTYNQIAKHFGFSRSTIAGIIHRYARR